MGNSLDKPITDKETLRQDPPCTGGVCWAISGMQGWRTSMEDAQIGLSSLRIMESSDESCCSLCLDDHHLLGIFDGHGGRLAAAYCADNFYRLWQEHPKFLQYARAVGRPVQDESQNRKHGKAKRSKQSAAKKRILTRKHPPSTDELGSMLRFSLEETFLRLDLELFEEMKHSGLIPTSTSTSVPAPSSDADEWAVTYMSESDDDGGSHRADEKDGGSRETDDYLPGTAAVVAIITPQFIVCANLGDSRAILSSKEEGVQALSRDHKPSLPEESIRIEKDGGKINFGRVDGVLAMSRALGDYGFKRYMEWEMTPGEMIKDTKKHMVQAGKQRVSPLPEVTVHQIQKESDLVLVLACDGVFDVLTNDECIQEVTSIVSEGEHDMGLVCEEILDICLKRGTRDNATVAIVRFPIMKVGTGGGVAKRRTKRDKA